MAIQYDVAPGYKMKKTEEEQSKVKFGVALSRQAVHKVISILSALCSKSVLGCKLYNGINLFSLMSVWLFVDIIFLNTQPF